MACTKVVGGMMIIICLQVLPRYDQIKTDVRTYTTIHPIVTDFLVVSFMTSFLLPIIVKILAYCEFADGCDYRKSILRFSKRWVKFDRSIYYTEDW